MIFGSKKFYQIFNPGAEKKSECPRLTELNNLITTNFFAFLFDVVNVEVKLQIFLKEKNPIKE